MIKALSSLESRPTRTSSAASAVSTTDLKRLTVTLGEVTVTNLSIQNLFIERFQAFSEPMGGAECAGALCEHHLKIQQGKSADGKRPWFDRLGPDRIYIRHAYREPRREIAPGRYLHEYRGRPIGRFRRDLS